MTLPIILIGAGPHSRRVYLPALRNLTNRYNCSLSLVVDLASRRDDIIHTLHSFGYNNCEYLFIEPFKGQLPTDIQLRLDEYIKINKVVGVIIATEPLVHYAYCVWALENKLHILLDKPITARANIVGNPTEATALVSEYEDLIERYARIERSKAFLVNTQRRYHAGFDSARKLVAEVASIFQAPITSLQAMHCDGQWRLPSEIVTQKYHPYNQGYGKISHSGYHVIDLVCQFLAAANIQDKAPDRCEVFSSFLQPEGFLTQFQETDYYRYFGSEYRTVQPYSDNELRYLYQDYGEIDATAVVRLKQKNTTIGNLTINLLHNGFARRSWMKPGSDLYKGNGRVKHEYYNIQQGPFQNIQIHSYQSNDKHDEDEESNPGIGGNNHFDVLVFRNSKMFSKEVPFQKLSFSQPKNSEYRLCSEATKQEVVEEFLDIISGKLHPSLGRSVLGSHRNSVKMMAAMYSSHATQQRGEDVLASFEWTIPTTEFGYIARGTSEGSKAALAADV
jgi:predicted dehydrogenase